MTCLGIQLRYFARVTCPKFATKETAAESNKRKRKEVTSVTKVPDSNARKPKTFNTKTIKLHSLGDYVSHIRTHGTTDSYDTGIVSYDHRTCNKPGSDASLQSELSHGRVKTRQKARTSKKNTMRQLGNIDFVESQVRRIAAKVDAAGVPMGLIPSPSTVAPTARYHIAQDTKKPLVLGEWLINHSDDPALKVMNLFISRLHRFKALTEHCRTSTPTSNNTSMHASVSQTHHTIMVTTRTLSFKTASSINIQLYE